jgi:poly-beta-1,6-N-acetyl-D-glucosamine synthase
MLEISLGIMAYNEEANIGQLLKAVIDQKFTCGRLSTIYVVASGCTDRTEEIIRAFMKKDERIRLLTQPRREGKAAAINLFLSHAAGDIFILESGDTIPEKDTLDKLVTPFKKTSVGMTGSHPVPVNSENTFIGFTVNLMWRLHHRIALTTPKLGELVAFRSLIKEIPVNTAVDEASIESIIRKAGYELRYVPDAVVHNKGPENIKDFLKQRRRIAAGHKHLMIEESYEVSTMDPKKILKILFQEHTVGFKNILWTLGAVMLEIIGRGLGYYDFHVRKKNPFIWDIATSTKKLS